MSLIGKVGVVAGVLVVLALGGAVLMGLFSSPEIGGNAPVVDNLEIENSIPTVQPTENSFGILTPEEKAARDAAARAAAEASAQAASSTATTSDETTDEAEGVN